MKRSIFTIIPAIVMAFFLSAAVQASDNGIEDTDTRFVDARVVEVAEQRISVIARSGVEHVIAIDGLNTRVLVGGRQVRAADLRIGDIVTVELDAESPLKLARHISVGAQVGSRVAKIDR